MTTTIERVEITPELLDLICEAAQAIEDAPSIMAAIGPLREYREVASIPVVLALIRRIRELESTLTEVTTYVCPHGTAPSRACALCHPTPNVFTQGHAFTTADLYAAYVWGASEARDNTHPPSDDLLYKAADAYVKSVHPLSSPVDTNSSLPVG